MTRGSGARSWHYNMDALLKFARQATGRHDVEILTSDPPRAGPSANRPIKGGVDAQPLKCCGNVTAANTKIQLACMASPSDKNSAHPPHHRDESAATRNELAPSLRLDSLMPTLPNTFPICAQTSKDTLSALLHSMESDNDMSITAEPAPNAETKRISSSLNQVPASSDTCSSAIHSNGAEEIATKGITVPDPPTERTTAKTSINEQPSNLKSTQERTPKMKLTVRVPSVALSVSQTSADELARNSSDQTTPTDFQQISPLALHPIVESSSVPRPPSSQAAFTSNPKKPLICHDARGQRDHKKLVSKRVSTHLKKDENALGNESAKSLPGSAAHSSPKVSSLRKQAHIDVDPFRKKSYLAVALQPQSASHAPNLARTSSQEQATDIDNRIAQQHGALVRPKPRANPPQPWPQSRFPPLRSDSNNRTHTSAAGNRLRSKISDISKPNRASAFDRVYNKNKGSDTHTRPPPIRSGNSSIFERIGACIEKAEMQSGHDPRVISRDPHDRDTFDTHIAKVEQELRDLEQRISVSDQEDTMRRDYDAATGIPTSSQTASNRPAFLQKRTEGRQLFAELTRARKRERELFNQIHKLTEENASIEKRELKLLQDSELLKGEKCRLKDKLSLLETLYLDQVEVSKKQTKALHDLRQARVAPHADASRTFCTQSTVNHLRTEFHNLQNSYHNLAAENSMLHTKLKALTSSFRVASSSILSHVQVSDPVGDTRNNNYASNCGSQSTNVSSSTASQPVCVRRGGHRQFAYPHGRPADRYPSSLGVSVVLPAA